MCCPVRRDHQKIRRHRDSAGELKLYPYPPPRLLQEVLVLQSRLSVLTAFGLAAGITAVAQFAKPAFAQHPVPPPINPKPSPNAPQDQNAPMGLNGPQLTPAQKQTAMNRQPNTALRTEAEKLWEMANELRTDMLHSNPGETLSLTFVRKAQAIEKSAQQIKDQAKG